MPNSTVVAEGGPSARVNVCGPKKCGWTEFWPWRGANDAALAAMARARNARRKRFSWCSCEDTRICTPHRCFRPISFYLQWRATKAGRSILRRQINVIDDKNLHRPLFRFKLQPQLLLESRKD